MNFKGEEVWHVSSRTDIMMYVAEYSEDVHHHV